MPNLFTVDLEEYYHTESVSDALLRQKAAPPEDRAGIGVRKILELLEVNKSKATFFTLGALARKNPGLIREIASLGHEIASHGNNHLPLQKFTPEAFDADLSDSIKILSDLTRQPVLGYRAVSFSLKTRISWFFQILKKNNLRYDSSVCVSFFRRSAWELVRSRGFYKTDEGILEFPVSFFQFGPLKIPLGSGYFRTLPYWFLSRSLRQPVRGVDTPSVFYIHPWELDPGQPRFRMPALRHLRHYYNLGATENKLLRLLSETRFISIRGFLENR